MKTGLEKQRNKNLTKPGKTDRKRRARWRQTKMESGSMISVSEKTRTVATPELPSTSSVRVSPLCSPVLRLGALTCVGWAKAFHSWPGTPSWAQQYRCTQSPRGLPVSSDQKLCFALIGWFYRYFRVDFANCSLASALQASEY